MTEAVALCESRRNTDGFGMARCTARSAPLDLDDGARELGLEHGLIARSLIIELVPSAESFWIISMPWHRFAADLAGEADAPPGLGFGDGDRPEGLSLNSMPAAVSASITWPLSRSDSCRRARCNSALRPDHQPDRGGHGGRDAGQQPDLLDDGCRIGKAAAGAGTISAMDHPRVGYTDMFITWV